jgi:hypothetical protein
MEEEKSISLYTVGQLIEYLKQFDSNLQLDLRYDSGHGRGWFYSGGFKVVEEKLRIDVS